MKKEKIKKIILISIGILLILLIGLFICSKTIFKEKEKNENIQNEENLINDYYTYVNKDILDEMEFSKEEIGWNRLALAQQEADEKTSDILKELLNNKTYKDVNILYNNFLDLDSRNSVGLKPLQKYIYLIDNSKDINQFINNAITVENDLYIDIFTAASVGPDFKDTSKNIVYFNSVSLGLGGDIDIYVDEDYESYLDVFRQYEIEILKLYGYPEAKAEKVVNDLNKFYKNVSKKSKTQDELLDIESNYNIMTKDELQKIYTNLDINNYLKLMQVDDQEYFSVIDPGNYEVINAHLTNENLPLLKEFVKMKILINYSSYVSTDYYELINELNNTLLGTETKIDFEEDAISFVSSNFEETIDTLYLERHFTEEDKELMNTMINDILKNYKNNIKNLEWMSPATKQKAITKLENIKINIGGTYSKPIIYNFKTFNEGSSLVENVIIIKKYISNYELNRLKTNSVDEYLSSTVVNAYYNTFNNSINFPAAVLELYDEEDDYYKILGSIGTIIAHEITHAFDNNGAKFDEKGNLFDWWLEEDYNNFEQLQNSVSEYYSKYEVLDGIYVDGDLTVGENIADLGAVNCIVQVAKTKNATESDLKKLFESYASLWAGEYNDETLRMLVLTDIHAPDKVRVNAVLSSIDEFYEVYDIKEDDLMYVEKSKRVKVW